LLANRTFTPILKVTRKDVAIAAGVSTSTVGMILSGLGKNYSLATRRLVEETAEKLGYQPSINARALRLQRSLLIGVMLNEVNAHLSAQFLLGLQDAISATDYSPVVFFTKGAKDQELCLGHCLNRQVDALVVNCSVDSMADGIQAFTERVKELRIPVIEVFGRFLDGIPNVNEDNVESGRLCTSHLLDLGHRRVAMITHGRYDQSVLHFDAWEQFQGYRNALASAGVEPVIVTPEIDFDNVSIGAFIQAGHDALDLLLALPEVPTAVVCYSDTMAYGLNRACREKGIRVPEDLSIAGNYDMLLSSVVNPALTTTLSNHFEVGRQAASHLLDAINGAATTDSVLVASTLLQRESTGPVPGTA
jgi:LacI family transcriptional regulator